MKYLTLTLLFLFLLASVASAMHDSSECEKRGGVLVRQVFGYGCYDLKEAK